MNYTIEGKIKSFKKVISGLEHFNNEDVYRLNVSEGRFDDFLKIRFLMLLPEFKKKKYCFERDFVN